MRRPFGLTLSMLVLSVLSIASAENKAIGQKTPAENKTISQKTLEGLKIRPTVTVTVHQTSPAVTAAFVVRVHIINLTEHGLVLDKIIVEPPVELLAARGLKNWKDGTIAVNNALLNSGDERDFFFTFQRDDSFYLFRTARLTLLPADYDLRVVVFYGQPLTVRGNNVYEVATVHLEPPISSLIVGAIIGALLSTVFLLLSRHREWSTKGGIVTNTALIALAASVSSCIAILLLERLKGVSLPVQVTVQDFSGAIVIGLFSSKLGAWLRKRLV
jgi:hypothetical protein